MKDIVTSASHISKLPKKCFKTVKVPILQEEENENIDFEDPYPLIAGEEEKTYIRAKYVMQHFSASFFEMMRDLGTKWRKKNILYVFSRDNFLGIFFSFFETIISK